MRVAAVVLGVALALAAAEIGMRLVGYEPGHILGKVLLIGKASQRSFHCYPSNPNHEFSRVPDTAQGDWQLEDMTIPPRILPLDQLANTPWCVEYELSSMGVRDKELSYRPAPGVCRIACLGDSFVIGEGVPFSGTLPKQLQSRLGNDYELVNLGASGLNTRQEVERLLKFRHELEFQRVLLFFIPNDVEYDQKLAARQEYIYDLINVREEYVDRLNHRSWYGGPSRLLALAGAPLAMRRITNETIQWYRDLYDPAHNADGLRALSEQFALLADLDKCRVVLVLYPLIEGFEGQYPLSSVHERVAKLASDAGLPVCDLAPTFAGMKTAELQVHPVDHHPNSKANAVAADAVLNWLKANDPSFLTCADIAIPGSPAAP